MTTRRLQVVVLAAALWVIAVAALAVPLGALGAWGSLLLGPLFLLAMVVTWLVVAMLPAPTDGAPGRASRGMLLVLPAVVVGGWLAATSAEQVLPRRDAASNLQAAVSLTKTGHRIVEFPAEALGLGAALERGDVTVASPAFYAVGPAGQPSVQPQFVIGPAALYSLGVSLGGVRGATALAALAVALALLGLGLLVADHVGPWWGGLCVLLTGLSFPVVHVGRATYSEPLAMLTLVGGLLALTRAVDASPARARRLGVLGGLLVGGTMLLRIDGLREVILLLPVLALYAVSRAPWVRAAVLGTAAATAYAGVAAIWLSPRYLGDIARSLVPLVALGVLLVGVSWGALWWWRRSSAARAAQAEVVGGDRLPRVAAVLVVLVGLGLASRPLWLVTRQSALDPGARYVAGMQARAGLPVDGGRTYAEDTVTWLGWYLGPVTLVLALGALAVLVARLVRAPVAAPAWGIVVLVAAGSTLLTLLRPGITPDQPWALRRLVIAVPFAVALACVAAAWASSRLTERFGGSRLVSTIVAGVLVVGVAAPTVAATWPHRDGRVERGSMAAVERTCSFLRPGDVVLAVDGRAGNEWPQVVRGMCGRAAVAATAATRRDPAALERVAREVGAEIAEHGGRLVLLAADGPDVLSGLGLVPVEVVNEVVFEDEHALERRPDRLDPLPIRVWVTTEAYRPR